MAKQTSSKPTSAIKDIIVKPLSLLNRQEPSKNPLVVWSLNLLGIFLLALVPIIGPIPGPGGIPLLLLALHILGINNPWARRFKKYVLKKNKGLSDLIFINKRSWQIAWDIFAYSNFIISVILLWNLDWEFQWSLKVIFSWNFIWGLIVQFWVGGAVVCWLRNRYRWRRFCRYLKSLNRKK